MKAAPPLPSLAPRPADAAALADPANPSSDPFILGQLARAMGDEPADVLVMASAGETRGRVDRRLAERFAVTATRTWAEATARLRERRFALCLLDYREGDRSPEELARELRGFDHEMSVLALGAGKSVRVIGEHSLQVPFDLPELLDLAEHEIDMSRRRRGRSAAVREMESIIAMLQREVEAKDSLAKQGEASASMVHDLKNALVSTIGYTTRLLHETAQLKDDVGDRAQPIDAIARKLEHTSNYLLHLAHTCRLGDGHAPRERVALGAELEHVHAVLFFHSPHLTIETAPGAGSATVRADRYELHRVFQNLFKNAFEAGATRVIADLRREGDRAVVTVRDDGPGFPADEAPLALNRPLRSSKRGGQGIGLRICREIIERHGGSITLRNAPGAGAEFLLTLPLADA